MSVYWDTSCILKLYCRESDSGSYLNQVEQSAAPLVTSSLTSVELYFALLQKETRAETGGKAAHDLFRDFDNDLAQGLVVQIPVGEALSKKAREIADKCYAWTPPVHLRSLDGLHLATALHAGCRTVATTDLRMKTAAPLLGLSLL